MIILVNFSSFFRNFYRNHSLSPILCKTFRIVEIWSIIDCKSSLIVSDCFILFNIIIFYRILCSRYSAILLLFIWRISEGMPLSLISSVTTSILPGLLLIFSRCLSLWDYSILEGWSIILCAAGLAFSCKFIELLNPSQEDLWLNISQITITLFRLLPRG